MNARTYEQLVDGLNLGALARNIITWLVNDITTDAGRPEIRWTDELDETLRGRLARILPRVDGEDFQQRLDDSMERLHDSRAALFDFPVELTTTDQPLQTHTVGGDLTITADAKVPPSALDLYELSLHYYDADTARALYHKWDTAEANVANKAIAFEFSLIGNIAGPIQISVKGVRGDVLWQQQYAADDATILDQDNVHIQVALQQPTVLAKAEVSQSPDALKLRGRVVQMGDKYNLNQLTVIVAAKDEDGMLRTVSSGLTDQDGNFTLPYPAGDFVEAKAAVSLRPQSPVDIPILERPGQTISDDFLYILIADGAGTDDAGDGTTPDDDCSCKADNAPRLPDQQDLIGSGLYSQDLGGSCVNLTTPNRTLRENFHKAIVRTSDPDVSDFTLTRYTNGQDSDVSFSLSGGTQTVPRDRLIDLQNPIRWADAPNAGANTTFYQAVSVATGHILHYKSVFKSDGYSLGNLLYSLPLAPGQKKQIVVFDSSHSLAAAETQQISQRENLVASILNDRSIVDQLSGGLAEALTGSSSSTTEGVSAGLGASASLGFVGASLGVSGGSSSASSSASQNNSRNVSQFFGEQLRQLIMQNAESYRQLNASVVTTVQENQHYGVTAEAVANHNHCHALTMMYFEVLRHYAVFQKLASIEECVFVPLLLTNFTLENVYKWKDTLARNLLSINSNTYLLSLLGNRRQPSKTHPLAKGFDAIERKATQYKHVDYPQGSYADEVITEITGTMTLRINIPRPKTRFDRILSFPVIKKTVTSQGGVDIAGSVKDTIVDSMVGAVVPCAAKGPSIKRSTVSTEVLSRKAIFDMFMSLDANYESVPPAHCLRVHFDAVEILDMSNLFTLWFEDEKTPMDFFAGMDKDRRLWEAYAAVMGISLKELFGYFNNNVVADWDRIFNDNIAPVIVDRLLNDINSASRINIAPLALDFTADKYNGGERILQCTVRGTATVKRSAITELKISYSSPLSDLAQHSEFFEYVTFNVETLNLNYRTAFSSGTLVSRGLRDDLRDAGQYNNPLKVPTPLSAAEKLDPRKEDTYIANQLLQHLNSNLEHYNRSLWRGLDPQRRYMLLDGFGIKVYDEKGNALGYRSLASVVKNELVSVVGNSLVFPVAAGCHVTNSYIVAGEDDAANTSVADALFTHYQPLTPFEPYRVSVPNRGVFLEAVKGSCDACEPVQPDTSQDWDVFKTEEPTAIQPIITPTPALTDWKAVFRDLAQPIVNIQNAPALPAPAAGLAGLNELLGKDSTFADITGLAGTQSNAMQTYQSNQENVRALAEMAKGLASQEHNTSNSDKIVGAIKDAKRTGMIDSATQNELMKQHLKNQIDGGESDRANAAKERTDSKPSLAQAAISAADKGKSVQATKTDSDGNHETVSISPAKKSGDAVNVVAKGAIIPIAQSSAMTCWAAVVTILINWKEQPAKPLSVEDVIKRAGKAFTDKFKANETLKRAEKDTLIDKLGMVADPGNFASHDQDYYADLIRDYGPIWVTVDVSDEELAKHARIVYGVKGDGTPSGTRLLIIDPDGGRKYEQQFLQFVKEYEDVVRETPPKDELFIQIVRFKDKVPGSDKGEGSGAVSAKEIYDRLSAMKDIYDAVNNVADELEKLAKSEKDERLLGAARALHAAGDAGIKIGGEINTWTKGHHQEALAKGGKAVSALEKLTNVIDALGAFQKLSVDGAKLANKPSKKDVEDWATSVGTAFTKAGGLVNLIGGDLPGFQTQMITGLLSAPQSYITAFMTLMNARYADLDVKTGVDPGPHQTKDGNKFLWKGDLTGIYTRSVFTRTAKDGTTLADFMTAHRKTTGVDLWLVNLVLGKALLVGEIGKFAPEEVKDAWSTFVPDQGL